MTIDYTTSAGRVRMLIGDTGSVAIVSDAEVTAALALNGSDVYGAAADLCRAIAASAAKSAIAYDVLGGELKVDRRAIPDKYLALADRYEARIGATDTSTGFVDWSLRIDATGKDDTEYEDGGDDAEYFEEHFEVSE